MGTEINLLIFVNNRILIVTALKVRSEPAREKIGTPAPLEDMYAGQAQNNQGASNATSFYGNKPAQQQQQQQQPPRPAQNTNAGQSRAYDSDHLFITSCFNGL